MDDAQAAKWTADQEATAKAAEVKETATTASEPSTQFFTGKPYVADAGGYIYQYRTYNPEMSRWTTADPSGFPDGANNYLIVSDAPITSCDDNGLDQTVTLNGISVTINDSTPGAKVEVAIPGSSVTNSTSHSFTVTYSLSGTATLSGTIELVTGKASYTIGVNANPTIDVGQTITAWAFAQYTTAGVLTAGVDFKVTE
jgi:RHS repeat-associated protein